MIAPLKPSAALWNKFSMPCCAAQFKHGFILISMFFCNEYNAYIIIFKILFFSMCICKFVKKLVRSKHKVSFKTEKIRPKMRAYNMTAEVKLGD